MALVELILPGISLSFFLLNRLTGLPFKDNMITLVELLLFLELVEKIPLPDFLELERSAPNKSC